MKEIITKYEEIAQKIKGKKLHGAVFAILVKQYIEKELSRIGKTYKVSEYNAFISGSESEYDLLIVKSDSKPILDIIYSPEDVIAVIECKAGGLYNIDTETDSIVKAFKKAYSLNPHIIFGYITLVESVPVNEYRGGKPTCNFWERTQQCFQNKLPKDLELVEYAMRLKKGNKIIAAGSDDELKEFVRSFV